MKLLDLFKSKPADITTPTLDVVDHNGRPLRPVDAAGQRVRVGDYIYDPEHECTGLVLLLTAFDVIYVEGSDWIGDSTLLRGSIKGCVVGRRPPASDAEVARILAWLGAPTFAMSSTPDGRAVPTIFAGMMSGYPISVHRSISNSEGEAVWSLCDFDRREIRLDASMPRDRRARSIHIEAFHAFDRAFPGLRATDAHAAFAATVAIEVEGQIERQGGWTIIDAMFDTHERGRA